MSAAVRAVHSVRAVRAVRAVRGQRELYAALGTTAVATGPLVLLDPTWPAAQREAARRAVSSAVAAEIGTDDLVVFTSGSLGTPRAVVRTWQSWRASLAPLTEVTGLTGEDTVWLPGPLWSSLFLYGAFHARHLGADVVLADESSLAERATAVHVVPSMLPGLLGRRARGELCGIRTVVVAGDRLPEDLRTGAAAAGWRVVEYYGAAELSFVGWRERAGPMRPFPGVRVEIRAGVVWVASAYLARGYLGDVPGPLRRAGDWATVGDLGHALPGGFVVTGRADAAVTVGGHTVVVEDVEAVLRAVPGVTDVAVLGVPHPRLGQTLAAVVEGTATVGTLRSAVAGLPTVHRPRRFVLVDRLPRTAAGKLRRADLTAALARGGA